MTSASNKAYLGTPSPLAVSLALFALLDSGESAERGMSLAELSTVWPRTGMSAEDLNGALTRSESSGDFQTVFDAAGPRVRVAGFERAFLDPKTLIEIDQLLDAYAELRTYRRGRRPHVSSLPPPQPGAALYAV